MSRPSVNVGDWYLDREHYDFVCVVDVDEDEGVIDVRDEYGQIDEIDFEEWANKDLVLCSNPRVWKDAQQDDEDEEELRDPDDWDRGAQPD